MRFVILRFIKHVHTSNIFFFSLTFPVSVVDFTFTSEVQYQKCQMRNTNGFHFLRRDYLLFIYWRKFVPNY